MFAVMMEFSTVASLIASEGRVPILPSRLMFVALNRAAIVFALIIEEVMRLIPRTSRDALQTFVGLMIDAT